MGIQIHRRVVQLQTSLLQCDLHEIRATPSIKALPVTPALSSPAIRIYGNTQLMPDGYKNNRRGMMDYDLRRKAAMGKWTGCWFANILKFNGHFSRKRNFKKIHSTHLTTSCLRLSDSPSRPPTRTTVWKPLANTRKSLCAGKWQAPNPSLLGNSPSNKHTLEKQAGKMQNVATKLTLYRTHLLSVKLALGFKYRVDFTSHINWWDYQQDSLQLCLRFSSQLNKSPDIPTLVLLIGEISYNNANTVLNEPGWHERRPWEPKLA